MTLTEFMLALKATPRNWLLVNNTEIRGFSEKTGYPCCPVLAVGDSDGNWINEEACELACLLFEGEPWGEDDSERLLTAADYRCDTSTEGRLRRMLLWATDLEEV